MSAQLLSGVPVAEAVLAGVKARADKLRARGIKPTLATILVGEDPASSGYVRKKHETCELAGLVSVDARLPATAAFAELRELIRGFNADPGVHGVIVQSPLPKPLDFNAALLELDPKQDADGLRP